MQLNLNKISYTYPGASQMAVHDTTAVFPQGWTGIVGDNGCGKTTLARIACGLLQPDAGTVTPRLFSVYCEQDASVPPDVLYDLAGDWSSEALELRRLLQIDDEWLWRYESLSGGQQKRIQIACALWQRPDALVMDEPTNDLDAATRNIVAAALASFQGIGILISHDRALLDGLVQQCFMCEAERFIMRPGGYTKAAEQAQRERTTLDKQREQAKREKRRLEAEAARRKAEADRSAARRSARNLDKHDSDGRGRIGLAIVTGKDGVAARQSAVMDARLARVGTELEKLQTHKRYAGKLEGFGSASKARSVAHIAAGSLSAGEFCLQVPELWVGPTDHIVLTGDNGTGKSLLVRELVAQVAESTCIAYVPQETDARMRDEALRRLKMFSPKDQGRILALVGSLNSDPQRILDGDDVSPGEMKKLLLAEQLVDDPHLLILDEPTNHLDMGSIDALGNLLAGFPGAFLLVTHDQHLGASLEGISWTIERIGDRSMLSVG